MDPTTLISIHLYSVVLLQAETEESPPKPEEEAVKPPHSTLTQQLAEMESHGSNPFFKYAKFDGRVSII